MMRMMEFFLVGKIKEGLRKKGFITDLENYSFVGVCYQLNVVKKALIALAWDEIQRRETVEQLFRIESVTTRFFRLYHRRSGRRYLEKLILPFLNDPGEKEKKRKCVLFLDLFFFFSRRSFFHQGWWE